MAQLKSKRFQGMNDQQLRELYESEKAARDATSVGQPQQTAQPAQGGQDIASLVAMLSKAQQPTIGQGIGNAISILGGGKPAERKGADMSDLLNLMKIQQMQNPGQAPEGYINVGGEYKPDPKFVDPVEQSRIDVNKQKTGSGAQLNPARQAMKEKRMERLLTTFEENKPKKQLIANAEKSLPNVPTGRMGAIKSWWLRNFDTDNPVLKDWQNVKMVLTDATLMNTAKTKGAISDFEMAELMKAAANDDLMSVQRAKPVIDKLTSFLEADEDAQVSTFNKLYKDDPRQWEEMQEFNVPEFASEDEVRSANIPDGTRVKINGVYGTWSND